MKLRTDYDERNKISYTTDFKVVDAPCEQFENEDRYSFEPVRLDVEERNEIIATHNPWLVTDKDEDEKSFLLIPDVTSYTVKTYNSNAEIFIHRINEETTVIRITKDGFDELDEEEQDEFISDTLYENAKFTNSQFDDIMLSLSIWLNR